MSKKLPAIITAAQVAELLDCSVQKARRWLQATKTGHKRGRWWVTTPGQLQKDFPELFERLLVLHETDDGPCAGCLKLGAKMRATQDQSDEKSRLIARLAAELSQYKRAA